MTQTQEITTQRVSKKLMNGYEGMCMSGGLHFDLININYDNL